MEEKFYVYILECNDDTYYVGHTGDIERRLSEHAYGKADCYTAERRPVKLVFIQKYLNRAKAFLMERKIKGWSRKKKQALISGHYEQLKSLSKKQF